MESIDVIIDDEEIEAPSKGEENQPISAELPIPSADMIKTSTSPQETPGMSPAKSLPIPATSNTIASASEDEDNPTNPPKQSWVISMCMISMSCAADMIKTSNWATRK
jgi:deoxyribose-phosphate aldolase